ncbi:hypothetical protein WA171_005041 [Blastocystis sp. BT1]
MSEVGEIAAPLGEEAWDDTALLDAFERAAATHNEKEIPLKSEPSKDSNPKKKSKIIFKRTVTEDEGTSEDQSEAFVAPAAKPTPIPVDNPVHPSPTSAGTVPQMSTNYQNSFIPTVPDLEEQEALSQLLLAWSICIDPST